MIQGFWQSLPRPVIGLAPMDGVTDAAFRYIIAKYGKPSLVITEFTSAEGIMAGAERLLDDFYYSPLERPVVAQLFGANPQAFYGAALVAAALGFDGVDINMGCPAKNVTQKGAGAALILDPERAKEIIRQARAGVEAWAAGKTLEEAGLPSAIIAKIRERQGLLGITDADRRPLPVSVKTRLGYDKPIIVEWVKHLLEVKPAAITIHGRTLRQLYTGEANWEAIAEAAPLIRESGALVLGNGDVQDLADAHLKIKTYGVDGVLIGRSSFGNPWVFQGDTGSFSERMRIALEHARYLDSVFPGKGFIRIRKHLLDYCKGVPSAKLMRTQLMRVSCLAEVEEILDKPIQAPDGLLN